MAQSPGLTPWISSAFIRGVGTRSSLLSANDDGPGTGVERWTYCIDTSALIDLRPFRRTVFVTLWANLDGLVAEDRLISPDEVLHELERGDDELLQWAREHRSMFKQIDEQVWMLARDVAKRFPTLVDHTKLSADADAFVVAVVLAQPVSLLSKFAVVAHERTRMRKARIGDACAHYGLDYLSIQDMFDREGWRF